MPFSHSDRAVRELYDFARANLETYLRDYEVRAELRRNIIPNPQLYFRGLSSENVSPSVEVYSPGVVPSEAGNVRSNRLSTSEVNLDVEYLSDAKIAARKADDFFAEDIMLAYRSALINMIELNSTLNGRVTSCVWLRCVGDLSENAGGLRHTQSLQCLISVHDPR